jgi:hypothetical protein
MNKNRVFELTCSIEKAVLSCGSPSIESYEPMGSSKASQSLDQIKKDIELDRLLVGLFFGNNHTIKIVSDPMHYLFPITDHSERLLAHTGRELVSLSYHDHKYHFRKTNFGYFFGGIDTFRDICRKEVSVTNIVMVEKMYRLIKNPDTI